MSYQMKTNFEDILGYFDYMYRHLVNNYLDLLPHIEHLKHPLSWAKKLIVFLFELNTCHHNL